MEIDRDNLLASNDDCGSFREKALLVRVD